jgi:putative DNA primase/helicase
MASAIPIETVLAKLGAVTPQGDQWMARCPVHDDRKNSLSVGVGHDGAILLHCFAGCAFDAIATALNVRKADLFQRRPRSPLPTILATYDYRDAAGALLYQVCRFQPKDFRQRRPNGSGWIWNMQGVTRVPYRLNELQGRDTVYVVEGEKDADALWAIGVPATTNVGGAGKWKDRDSDCLKTAGVERVILVPDNDGPGRKHMDDVAKSVKALGLAVLLLSFAELPAKADVSDWLRRGHTRAELEALVAAKLWVVPKGATVPDAPPPTDRDPLAWHHTDLGASMFFVTREGENLRFDFRQDRWLLWNAHLWHPDTDAAVYRIFQRHLLDWQREALALPEKTTKDALLKFLLQLESRSRTEAVVATTRRQLPVADAGDHWDQHPWLLGVGNGVVDLRTGVLRSGDRVDNLTMQTRTDFTPAATCPRWEQFLGEVFENDGPLIRYIQQALGYSLTGDMREQCFFMCVGSGSNGKSTFTGTLQALWGDYAYTTDMKTFSHAFGSEQGLFDMAELMNRRLILASETKAECRLNEQALKNFTGGEKINAQRKYGHPFEYQPVGKIWLGMNHQPTVKDDSYGFWRRVRIIPFLRTFGGSGANPHLREELAAEAPGILAWAVRGTLDWLKVGLQCPPRVFDATEAYKEAEDPLREFIQDCLDTTDPLSQTSSQKLYGVYRDWARLQGISDRYIMTATALGRKLSGRFQKTHSMNGTRYLGIRVVVRARDLLD